MIERKFIAQNFKEFQIKEYVKKELSRVGLSNVKLQRTSLGEKIIISASRPGLVVGRGGATIQRLTRELREQFQLENPQIEIEEITDFSLDAGVIAEMIVNQLERFGTQRFKGIGHKTLESVMRAGALGVEILISGKIPSSRAKTWRFVDGYMKKCGDLAITGVDTAKEFAKLKTGIVGVQVRIMPGTTKLPDQITFNDEDALAGPIVEEVETKILPDEESVDDVKNKSVEKPKATTKKSTKKTTKKSSKKVTKKEESKETDKKPNNDKVEAKEE
ncbi:30S ribosomal protein S3 [Candidatus Woesearchaeota archaeon]|nr:30S ribosomal protein S3 [Candidatus Woesearchaeota archaeon]